MILVLFLQYGNFFRYFINFEKYSLVWTLIYLAGKRTNQYLNRQLVPNAYLHLYKKLHQEFESYIVLDELIINL